MSTLMFKKLLLLPLIQQIIREKVIKIMMFPSAKVILALPWNFPQKPVRRTGLKDRTAVETFQHSLAALVDKILGVDQKNIIRC